MVGVAEKRDTVREYMKEAYSIKPENLFEGKNIRFVTNDRLERLMQKGTDGRCGGDSDSR